MQRVRHKDRTEERREKWIHTNKVNWFLIMMQKLKGGRMVFPKYGARLIGFLKTQGGCQLVLYTLKKKTQNESYIKCKTWNYKLLEVNTEKTISTKGLGKSSQTWWPKEHSQKKGTGTHQNLWFVKVLIRRIKRHTTDWEKIFSSHITDIGLM